MKVYPYKITDSNGVETRIQAKSLSDAIKGYIGDFDINDKRLSVVTDGNTSLVTFSGAIRPFKVEKENG